MAAALLLLSAQRGAGTELLRNGGFEEGLEGWRTLAQSSGARFELDEKVRASGKRSLRIERSGAGGFDFLKQFVELPVSEGKLRFSMRHRVERGAALEVVFYFNDEGGRPLADGTIQLLTAGRTRGFEKLERELAVPAAARGCGIDVILKQPGTVWVDDLSIVLLGYAPPRLGPLELQNPGFDEDLAGWRALEPSSGATEASVDRRVRSGGKGALRLERKSRRLFPEDGLWARVEDTGKARRVRLAFSARVEGDARAAVCLQALDARGVALETARLELAATGAEFQRKELALELPREAARLDVYLLVKGRGTAWFDELELGRR